MADIANGNAHANGTSIGPKLLWRHADPQSTAMYRYLQAVNQIHNLRLSTYPDLHQWSVDNIDAFWQSVWTFAGIRAEGDASPVSQSDTSSMYYIDNNRLSTLKHPCSRALNFSGMHV
jgi:acetoacetyl-CoA synthetase